MNYEQLKKANESLKTIEFKGKGYAQVNERVKAFRMICPNGAITTEIVDLSDGVVTMKSTIIDEDGTILATGYAQEKESASYINKTSFIENCETSAVGRALGFAGFGSDASIASAEEVANAIEQQDVIKAEESMVARIKKMIEQTNTDTVAFLKAVNYKYNTNYKSIDEIKGESLTYALKRITKKVEETK